MFLILYYYTFQTYKYYFYDYFHFHHFHFIKYFNDFQELYQDGFFNVFNYYINYYLSKKSIVSLISHLNLYLFLNAGYLVNHEYYMVLSYIISIRYH